MLTAWGESVDGVNRAVVACVYRCPVNFIASPSAIVAVFSAIPGALNKALLRGFSTPGIAAWCTGKDIVRKNT